MITKGLVSVVIPAYNHEEYVQDTIKSVISQTYQNIELIIVDDGSTDETWQKIQEMKDVCKKRFARVVFETKQNEGTCKTLNRLLDLANGEYIAIIASDDMYKPQAIEKETDFLNNNPDYALCVGDNEFIDSNNDKCYVNESLEVACKKAFSTYSTFSRLLMRGTGLNFNSTTFGLYSTLFISNYIPNGYLIRKSVFNNFDKFTIEAPLEDWYLMLQIAKYSKMKYLDEILFSYRIHDTNTIKNKEKMKLLTLKTKLYEVSLLKKLDLANISSEVLVFLKKGYSFYMFVKVPYLLNSFHYYYINDIERRTKIIKFLNIPIYKCEERL